jgi:hypothetical protein
LEQWVGVELWKRLTYLGDGSLSHFRTKDGAEVDFVKRVTSPGRGPLAVCATRRCHSKGTALRLELRVKGLTREEKDAIAEPAMFRAFARQSLRRAGVPRG